MSMPFHVHVKSQDWASSQKISINQEPLGSVLICLQSWTWLDLFWGSRYASLKGKGEGRGEPGVLVPLDREGRKETL